MCLVVGEVEEDGETVPSCIKSAQERTCGLVLAVTIFLKSESSITTITCVTEEFYA